MRSSYLLLAAVALGCDAAGSQEGTPTFAVATDRAIYGPSDVVAVAFTNRADARAFVHNDGCLALDREYLPNLRMERLEGGTWSAFDLGYGCVAVANPPSEVPPGEAHTVRFRVGVVDQPVPSGTYRYVFDVRHEEHASPEGSLPTEVRTSNAFEVRG